MRSITHIIRYCNNQIRVNTYVNRLLTRVTVQDIPVIFQASKPFILCCIYPQHMFVLREGRIHADPEISCKSTIRHSSVSGILALER